MKFFTGLWIITVLFLLAYFLKLSAFYELVGIIGFIGLFVAVVISFGELESYFSQKKKAIKIKDFFKTHIYLRFIPYYSLNEVVLTYLLLIFGWLFFPDLFAEAFAYLFQTPILLVFILLSVLCTFLLFKKNSHWFLKIVVILFVFLSNVGIILEWGFRGIIDYGVFSWINEFNGFSLLLSIIMLYHFRGFKYVDVGSSIEKKRLLIGVIGLFLIFFIGKVFSSHLLLVLNMGLFWILWSVPALDYFFNVLND